MPNAKNFFTKEQQDKIQEAIASAEKNTSGELRVYIENHSGKDVFKRATTIFNKLGMDKTAAKNGVLFYLGVKDHSFAILGDKGINDVVPADFWDEIKSHMLQHFHKGEFTEGLVEGIHMAGEKLKAHFPFAESDKNELPNEMTFGENKPENE